MPEEPKTYFSPRYENRKGKSFVITIPDEMYELLRRAQIIERGKTRLSINITEFIIRAVIDRIGRILGTTFARRLYRAYFNGIGQIRADIEYPEFRDNSELNIFITETKK